MTKNSASSNSVLYLQLHPLVPLVPSLRAYLDLRVNLLLLNFPKAQLDQLAPTYGKKTMVRTVVSFQNSFVTFKPLVSDFEQVFEIVSIASPLLHPRPLPPFDLAVQGCLACLPDLWAQGIRVHHAFPG